MSGGIDTSAQFLKEHPGKGTIFTQADGATKDVWIPAAKKLICVFDTVINVYQKQASKFVVVGLQIFRGGAWRTFISAGAGTDGTGSAIHNFGGRVITDLGDGSAARIRVAKVGDSADFTALIAVTGLLKP